VSDAANAYALLREAAQGSGGAARRLARMASLQAAEDADWVALIEALTFARLAWAGSKDPADAGIFMGLLGAASVSGLGEVDQDLCEQWEAEGIAVASLLAEQGEAIADQNLTELVDAANGSTAALAIEIAELMKEGVR